MIDLLFSFDPSRCIMWRYKNINMSKYTFTTPVGLYFEINNKVVWK